MTWRLAVRYGHCDNVPTKKIDKSGQYPVSLELYLSGFTKAINDFGDNIGKQVDQFFNGRKEVDPDGYPARVGGWVLNPKHNAMTLPPGVGYLHDDEDWDYYRSDRGKNWRNHEHQHIQQIKWMGAVLYIAEVVRGYVTTRSHDNAPLEIDADNYRSDVQWRPPFQEQ